MNHVLKVFLAFAVLMTVAAVSNNVDLGERVQRLEDRVRVLEVLTGVAEGKIVMGPNGTYCVVPK